MLAWAMSGKDRKDGLGGGWLRTSSSLSSRTRWAMLVAAWSRRGLSWKEEQEPVVGRWVESEWQCLWVGRSRGRACDSGGCLGRAGKWCSAPTPLALPAREFAVGRLRVASAFVDRGRGRTKDADESL